MQKEMVGYPAKAAIAAVAEVKDNAGNITTQGVTAQDAVTASLGKFWQTPTGYGPSGKSVFDYFPNA